MAWIALICQIEYNVHGCVSAMQPDAIGETIRADRPTDDRQTK